MAVFDCDFNYAEKSNDGEIVWSFGCGRVTCWHEEQIEDTLLGDYEDVELLDYYKVEDW